MPLKSEKQRRYMWQVMPELAKEWSRKYGSKPEKPDPKVKYAKKSK